MGAADPSASWIPGTCSKFFLLGNRGSHDRDGPGWRRCIPGQGVFSFTAVVALTLLATLSFDPRPIVGFQRQPGNGMNRLCGKTPGAGRGCRRAKSNFSPVRPVVVAWPKSPSGPPGVMRPGSPIATLFPPGRRLPFTLTMRRELEKEATPQLKFRGANVGAVKAIALTGGQSTRWRVRAQLAGSAQEISRRAGSIFWIVRPRS